MTNPIDWLVYLKAQGARYLIVPNEGDLKGFPALGEYIASHSQLIAFSGQSRFYGLAAANAPEQG